MQVLVPPAMISLYETGDHCWKRSVRALNRILTRLIGGGHHVLNAILLQQLLQTFTDELRFVVRQQVIRAFPTEKD